MPMTTWMTDLINLAPGGGAGVNGIPLALNNRFLHQIVVPGAHDAGCSIGGFSPLAQASRTQTLDMAGQLNHGVRYFDIRPTWYRPWNGARQWYTFHGNIGPVVAYYGQRIDGQGGVLDQLVQLVQSGW